MVVNRPIFPDNEWYQGQVNEWEKHSGTEESPNFAKESGLHELLWDRMFVYRSDLNVDWEFIAEKFIFSDYYICFVYETRGADHTSPLNWMDVRSPLSADEKTWGQKSAGPLHRWAVEPTIIINYYYTYCISLKVGLEELSDWYVSKLYQFIIILIRRLHIFKYSYNHLPFGRIIGISILYWMGQYLYVRLAI